MPDRDAATTAITAATNAAQLWASKTLIARNEIGYQQGMVVAALQAAAPLIEAEATARERRCIKQAIIACALTMGYEADEVWGVAFPHLADFVHDLLDGDGNG